MGKIEPGDTLYVGHKAVNDRIWSWDQAHPHPDDMSHEVWHKPHDDGSVVADPKSSDGQPKRLEPGTDYHKVTITNESILIEGEGYRARASHSGNESKGNMSVGRVVSVDDQPASP